MKKILLATTALVFASSSAAAIEVSLEGDISVKANVSLERSGFDSASWDANLALKVSDESLGWTYGGTMNFSIADPEGTGVNQFGDRDDDNVLDDDEFRSSPFELYGNSAAIYIGSDAIGRISFTEGCGNFVDSIDEALTLNAADEVGKISGHCVDWTGMNLGGLELKAAFGIDDEALIVGTEYLDMSLGKIDVEMDLINDTWDAEIATMLGGATIAVGFDYNSNESLNGGDVDYVVTAKGKAGDFNWALAYSPEGLMSQDTLSRTYPGRNSVDGFETENWNILTQSGAPSDAGDGFKAAALSLGYDCYKINLGIDLERQVDSRYDTVLSGSGATGFNSLSQFLATGGTFTAQEIALLNAITGYDNSALLGATLQGIGTAQTIHGGADEQGLLGKWEFDVDCEVQDGVSVTATLGADSARAAALEQANYVVSQFQAASITSGPLAGRTFSGYSTTIDLQRSSAIKGSIGMKITF